MPKNYILIGIQNFSNMSDSTNMDSTLQKTVKKINTFFSEYRWSPILWSICAILVLWTGFPNLIFNMNSSEFLQQKISILAILIPLSWIISTHFSNQFKNRLEKQTAEENVYRFIADLANCLQRENTAVLKFSSRVLDSKRFLNGDHISPVGKPVFPRDLFDILKRRDFFGAENPEFRKLISDLITQGEELAGGFHEMNRVLELLKGPNLRSGNQTISNSVSEETPFQLGPLNPQPYEFKYIYEYADVASDIRSTIHEVISDILDAIRKVDFAKIPQTERLSVAVERISLVMGLIGKSEAKAPIECMRLKLAIDVNREIEKLRSCRNQTKDLKAA